MKRAAPLIPSFPRKNGAPAQAGAGIQKPCRNGLPPPSGMSQLQMSELR